MEDGYERLAGMVENVTFENRETGFAVVNLACDDGELVCCVGPLAGCAPGETLALLGRYVQHATYGMQFEAAACSYRLPESEAGILKYLASGVLPGIGPATAKRMVQQFGEQALAVLAEDPAMLAAEVRGLSLEKAQAASAAFREIFGAREAMASLAALGLTATEAMAVWRQYGAATLQVVTHNPYLLCDAPLHFGFARADAIAERLSVDRDGKERRRAALLYTLRHNLQNGHTCLPKERLLQTAAGFFGIQPALLAEDLAALCEEGALCEVASREVLYIYLPDMLRAETACAARIRERASAPAEMPEGIKDRLAKLEAATGIQYAPLQKQAITEALQRRVLVITGGPGTGKTTAVNAIIALHEQQADRVLLTAPTGRAAKRMAEVTGRRATTIHRLLEAEYTGGSGQPRFRRNEQNPLKCDAMIVDEMSMVDAGLFESLLCALKPSCRLILVGDSDQLPSVGPGNVLRGILESGVVPAVALTQIFRQAAKSLIVANAHRIVEGKLPQAGKKDADWFFLKAFGSTCQRLVCDLVATRLPAGYGFHPLADLQVLCPGRRGPLGTEALNERLQSLLNPPAPDRPELTFGGMCYRAGDKVMQVKNNYDIPFTRTDGEPGVGAFNGDIGVVEQVNPATGNLTVLCEDRHVYYTRENLRELELAYAVTIHKSQGSEFEAVVIPVTEVPKKLRYRNLLYTGVTRAKRLCVLAGDWMVVEEMVHNERRNRRFSCFADFLANGVPVEQG